jgi:hypothetical protein
VAMTNYIPKMSDAVIRLRGITIMTIMELEEGCFIPFILDKKGKPIRADGYVKKPEYVSKKKYAEAMSQAYGIFSDKRQQEQMLIIDINKIEPEEFYGPCYSLEETDRLLVLCYNHIDVRNNGTLVIYRFDEKEGEFEAVPQEYETDDALLAAIRSRDHVLETYKGSKNQLGEIKKLIGIKEVLQDANDLLCHWHDYSPREIWDMEERVTEVVESLKRCSNIYKVLVQERMKNFTGIQDSLERINPPAIAAKTAAAIVDIIKRSNQANRRAISNTIKKQVLELEKIHEEMNIKQACFLLKAIVASHDKTLDNYDMINLKINRALYLLQSAWLNPYFPPSEKARTIINIGKKFCQEKKFNLARLMFSAAITIFD